MGAKISVEINGVIYNIQDRNSVVKLITKHFKQDDKSILIVCSCVSEDWHIKIENSETELIIRHICNKDFIAIQSFFEDWFIHVKRQI